VAMRKRTGLNEFMALAHSSLHQLFRGQASDPSRPLQLLCSLGPCQPTG
jgi:hypothetical protein